MKIYARKLAAIFYHPEGTKDDHFKAVVFGNNLYYTRVPLVPKAKTPTIQWKLSDGIEKQFPSANGIANLSF